MEEIKQLALLLYDVIHKNELYLKQTGNFYSHCQDEPYKKMYALLNDIVEATNERTYPYPQSK